MSKDKIAGHRLYESESWARHECPPLTCIEYNIYSYSNDDSPRACWQKCGSADRPDSAIIHAETLFKSGQFKRVEVKQKYFDLKTQRNIDETWKVFEKSRRPASSWIRGIAAATAIIVFALTYAIII